MNITTIGIDIAKNYIQIHGTNDAGKALLKKRLKREEFLTFMSTRAVCLVGMEACGGAHYWATKLNQLGFNAKIMSPQKVKKYADSHIKMMKEMRLLAQKRLLEAI